MCGKLLKAIKHHKQPAKLHFFFLRSDRPGVSYFRTPNSLESRDPQRPEPERRNPERRVPQCLLSVLERTILEELDWISSTRSNPIRSSQPKATCHLRKVLEQPEPERSSPRTPWPVSFCCRVGTSGNDIGRKYYGRCSHDLSVAGPCLRSYIGINYFG